MDIEVSMMFMDEFTMFTDCKLNDEYDRECSSNEDHDVLSLKRELLVTTFNAQRKKLTRIHRSHN